MGKVLMFLRRQDEPALEFDEDDDPLSLPKALQPGVPAARGTVIMPRWAVLIPEGGEGPIVFRMEPPLKPNPASEEESDEFRILAGFEAL